MDMIITTEKLLDSISGKSSVNALAEAMTFNVQEGMTNPLEFRVKAKMVIDALENAIKMTNDDAMVEQMKHGKRSEMFGAVIDSVETGVKYDYQSTNCPEWERFDEMVKHYSEQKKNRETFLKSLKEPINIVTDDGEIVTINPPIKSSTTALKITLK
jgi:transcriptional regulator with PAS, ATPase and Fis domain